MSRPWAETAQVCVTVQLDSSDATELVEGYAAAWKRPTATESAMAIRDAMGESVRPFLRDGEQLQAVIGAQTASAYVAGIAGALPFLGLNRYRIIAATSQRILVLDAGKLSMKKARGVVTELPRETSLGQPSGVWHVIPVQGEKLRVPKRFFKDVEQANAAGASGHS